MALKLLINRLVTVSDTDIFLATNKTALDELDHFISILGGNQVFVISTGKVARPDYVFATVFESELAESLSVAEGLAESLQLRMKSLTRLQEFVS